MTSTVPSKKPYRKAPPQHREIHHELPILCDEYDGVILAEQNQEPLTDAERIKLLQHDNEELRRRLAYVTNKMEAMERELESGQDYLEMELGQNREELEKFKDKFRRLQNSYTASQRTNQDLEEKLHALASLSQNWIFAVASFCLCVFLFLFTCFSLSSFIVVHALLSPTCTVFDGIQNLNQPATWV